MCEMKKSGKGTGKYLYGGCGTNPPGLATFQVQNRAARAHNWDDPEGYTEKLLREFSWMDWERKVVEKLAASTSLSIFDSWVLLENSHRMGMRMGIIDVFRMA